MNGAGIVPAAEPPVTEPPEAKTTIRSRRAPVPPVVEVPLALAASRPA